MSHKAWKFREGTILCLQKISGIGSFYAEEEGSRFCVANFLSHSTEKFRRGIVVFQKISGLKKLQKMVYHNFVENWFSHSTEKFRRWTLLFSENFLYRKFFWIGRGYHDFLWKFFCLTVPKKIPKSTLLIQKSSGLKKLHRMVYHNFVESCFSQSFEKFRRGTSAFQKVSGI